MNYYEELGLPRSASLEEIRQAYKNLARVLHPDRQSEPDLRRIAELQMIRLNEILATLSDPASRTRYDGVLCTSASGRNPGLEDGPQPGVYVRIRPFQTGKVRRRAGAIIWATILMATAAGFAFVFMYFEHDSGLLVYQTSEESGRQPSPPVPQAVRIRASHSSPGYNDPIPAVRHSEQAAVRAQAPQPVRSEPSAPVASNPSRDYQSVAEPLQSAAIQASPVSSTPPPMIAAVAKTVPTSRDRLIGTWLYVRPQIPDPVVKNFSYRPEYIEMIIKPGQEGKVLGTYKGQFHVPDRPISSEVIFRFDGPAAAGTNVFPWRDDDGASGQIRMQFVSDGVIDVSWYTTRFGSAQKLASGTAMLYRGSWPGTSK